MQRRATKPLKWLEDVSCEEGLRTLCLEKKRLRVDLTALFIFLRRRSGEGGTSLFSLVTNNRMYGNGTKLCQKRFRLDSRKNFFNGGSQTPKQVWAVDVPSLSVFKRDLYNAFIDRYALTFGYP